MASNNPQRFHAQAPNNPQRFHTQAPNNPQRYQAQAPQVQQGAPQSQILPQRPQRQHYEAPGHAAPSELEQMSLPPYLPPAQPIPDLWSRSSDNEALGFVPASNPSHIRGQEADSYYGVQGVNLPAAWLHYQPQLNYTNPYQAQPEYNVAGLPFVPMQVHNQTPYYTTAPLPHTQPYFTASAPTIQRPKATVVNPRHRGKNRASHVEPLPAAIVDGQVGHDMHSTPVLQRMSSGRLHDDDRRMYVKDLVPLLKQELELDVCQSAVLADIVFPSDCLPFPVDDSLLQHLALNRIWDSEGAYFLQRPTSFTEDGLAEWLNILGRTIGMAHNKKRLRIWSTCAHNLPPSGSKTIRKPDLVLLDRDDFIKFDRSRADWRIIRAFAEVSTQESFPERMNNTISEKTYVMFTCQDSRRFVPALKFDGSGNFAFIITDRQGQIQMGVISIFSSGKACALMFLRILAALMYGSPSDVGLDPSMICNAKGEVKTIFVNKKEFTVVRRIYALQSFIGRGTKVWVVARDSKFYILKDSWIQSGRLESEIDFLRRMTDDPYLTGRVPRIVEGEDLQIGNHPDGTGWCRIDIGQDQKYRTHRRHVTEPIGQPLKNFRSKTEFLSAMIDVVEVINHLFVNLNVLHRDISPNNMLLVRDSSGAIRCILIDYDYAATVKTTSERQVSPGFRTGTPPFMALEIMLKDGMSFRHDFRHDLESIFYVLLWVCCHMEGPEVERNNPFVLPLREWTNNKLKLHDLGLLKLSHLANFEDSILKHFTPYWDDVKPFMKQLKSAFWPESFETPNRITAEKMLSILKEAVANVQDMEVDYDNTGSSSSQSYVLLGTSKRRGADQDVAMSSKRNKSVSDAGGCHTHVRDLNIWKESVMVPMVLPESEDHHD